MVLPEDLRSELLRSFSRDEFANYRRALLSALAACRSLAGARQGASHLKAGPHSNTKAAATCWI
jgi:hypothetical protein